MVAEERMLHRPMDLLVPPQILRCNKGFTTDSANLSFGTVPARVVTFGVLASLPSQNLVLTSQGLTLFRTSR